MMELGDDNSYVWKLSLEKEGCFVFNGKKITDCKQKCPRVLGERKLGVFGKV